MAPQSESSRRSHWLNMSWAPGPGPNAPGRNANTRSALARERAWPLRAGASSSVLVVVVAVVVEIWKPLLWQLPPVRP